MVLKCFDQNKINIKVAVNNVISTATNNGAPFNRGGQIKDDE